VTNSLPRPAQEPLQLDLFYREHLCGRFGGPCPVDRHTNYCPRCGCAACARLSSDHK
jgi:hypothetical protein